MSILRIRQSPLHDGKYAIALRLQRPGQAESESEARIEFTLTEQEQEDLRWYLEDYLQSAGSVEAITVAQVEAMMKARGEELYTKVLAFNQDTQKIWFAVRDQLADLRIEVTTGVAEAALIPWELMRDPLSDSAISLRVRSFVRVQSNPNIGFVGVPPADGDRVRLLYVVCRPGGSNDVELRAVANRLLTGLGTERVHFQIKALRPPTFDQLQRELADAKDRGRPYHIVHFDGHGVYADLGDTVLKDWLASLSHLMLGGKALGKHGYLIFEHPGEPRMRPVDGQTLGQLLHDTGVPVLVLNACQSAMHEAASAPTSAATPHDEIRAIGSLAQAVIDQGIPAVLGMRYSVYVVTAAQYIGQLYEALAKGREFGQAATAGRKHLQLNPDRWVGLEPHPLQDWFVPVVHEAQPIQLIPAASHGASEGVDTLGAGPELDPVQANPALLRYVPEHGFTGRDETLLALDRAFDTHRVVLLHAYAGQGKTTTAVEFARWYALTGGLGERPAVLFTTFEAHADLDDLLNQVAQVFAPLLEAKDIDWSAINNAAQRRTLVLQLLRQAPILWIWDNVEPVAGFPEGTESQWTQAEQGDLRGFLHQIKLDAASRVKVLLTSRRAEENWLGGIPHRIAMPPMSNSDAARLALDLGRERHVSRAEIADWQLLLDYCRGNPLTLRVLVGQAVNMGLRGKDQIQTFVETIRDGEQEIADIDISQGRDKSLGASLDYGFRHAFKTDELPIIALLHLFQGTVDVDVLVSMSLGDALPELNGWTKEQFTSLLERGGEIGLLTHLGLTYYSIHPALPWFLRQLFLRYYDGQSNRSSAAATLRAWTEAIAYFGGYYHDQYYAGKRNWLRPLELEEANLLLARRYARRNQWWDVVISVMQGLKTICEYHGRYAEWSRLVAEIVPDYCTPTDDPILGREEEYTVVMNYRVHLLEQQERNYARAIMLQEKVVAFRRSRAAEVLALPADATLGDNQRAQLQSLGVAVFTLGALLQHMGDARCLAHFIESIAIDRRIGDKTGESTSEYNLGHAYKDISDVRDLDAAEAAYQRSLDLIDPQDNLGRAIRIKQIGMVHHARFREALNSRQPKETVLQYAVVAERHYIEALQLCPNDAITDLAPMHNQLGNLYSNLGQIDSARHYYELGARYFEKADDYYNAGVMRRNMGVMYSRAALIETDKQSKRNFLLRARAYTSAALLDFEHYQDRTAAEQAKTRSFLTTIDDQLTELGE